ncbi:hypothetical protein AB833_14375 [Chromatiales bacterium (ex Bugula neritina AB1)]|nr:hypothetical protein AB833_14375 [Chromatiales bacterium (ex Bugula neritina AB1)]
MALSTNLPVVQGDAIATARYCLLWINDKLVLRDKTTSQINDICVDFSEGRQRHRQQFGGGQGQPLARAVNIKGSHQPHICDGTGGLGADAYVFATLGAEVTILERSIVVHALLADGLRRARDHPETSAIAQRITAYPADTCKLPDSWPCNTKPAIIYLDPMYPRTRKNAAAKKGMQTLQRLLPHDTDERALLNAAISTATQRVVVKRPLKASPLPGPTCVGFIRSPNTRYDLYRGRG